MSAGAAVVEVHASLIRSGGRPFIPAGPVASVADTGLGFVVVGAYDSSVSIVDIATGASYLLGYHDHLVTAVAASPSGALLAAASADFRVSVWDLACEAPLQRFLVGHEDDVEAVTFLDEDTVVTGSRDATIRSWNVRTGASRPFRGHGKAVLSVTGDATAIVSSGDDMTLRIWRREDGTCVRIIGPFTVETDTCAVDPARGRLVLGADDGFIRVFSTSDGTLLYERHAHECAIKKVAVSIDGRVLSAAYDRALRVWTPELEAVVSLERPAGAWERSLTWARDGHHILGGTFDGNLVEWRA